MQKDPILRNLVDLGFDVNVPPEPFPIKSSYSHQELVFHGLGWTGEGNACLPILEMLMVEQITSITKDGGPAGMGQVIAVLSLQPTPWFFARHFKDDPVMPGCLQLDGLWQIGGFFLTWLGMERQGRATGVGSVVFSAEILPIHERVRYVFDVTRVLERAKTVVGDGVVEVYDGASWITACTAQNLKVYLKKSPRKPA